jgi:rubrerythrin
VRTHHTCKHCGEKLKRVRRTLAEKLMHGRVFECVGCGERHYPQPWLLIDRSSHAICPSCGTSRITVRSSPDPIEPVYRSPRSFLKRLFGGALYRCRFCRLQFYDLRPPRFTKDGSQDPTELKAEKPPAGQPVNRPNSYPG